MSNNTLAATGLITINASAQLPLKLTQKNYLSWRAQYFPLLTGCALLGYVTGETPCPANTITNDEEVIPNPQYALWIRQDQLILHAIIASVTELVISVISLAKTSHEAWTKLSKVYASNSRSRLMSLKDQLSRFMKGTKAVAEYMGQIKVISDELTIIGFPLDDIDLVIHTINGHGPEYKEISAAIRAHDDSISFEDLHDKLQEHERFLQREDRNPES